MRDPRLALAGCQILLALAIAWTAFTIVHVLPYWPVDPWLAINPWVNFDLDLTRCVRAILPATLLWGASFPLALAAAANTEDPGRLTGEVYAANTAGSIVGALTFSLLLIPAIGTQGSQQVLIWLAAAATVVAIAPVVTSRKALVFGGAVAGAALLAWGLAATVGAVPWQVIAYGRRVAPILRGLYLSIDAQTRPMFVAEGINLIGGDRTAWRPEIFLCER